MIEIYQIEVAPGDDEVAFDRAIKQIADTVVNFSATRSGKVSGFHVVKGDNDNNTNRYCMIVEGVIEADVFRMLTETSGLTQAVIFPASMQAISLGDFVSLAKWPKATWDLESN